jgi:hypothetical protein
MIHILETERLLVIMEITLFKSASVESAVYPLLEQDGPAGCEASVWD